MNNTTVNQARSLLDAPLRVATPATALGRAVLLYIAFILAANDQGFVIRKREQLAVDLCVSESDIDSWLARLVKEGLVAVLSPLPYLTVRLPFWSGRPDSVIGKAVLSAEEGRNSYSPATAISISSKAEDGGQGEGDLRSPIRAMLPEADDAELDRILNRYPSVMIRKAIDRVSKAGRIRKSKAALFRFLLTKFSEKIDVRDL